MQTLSIPFFLRKKLSFLSNSQFSWREYITNKQPFYIIKKCQASSTKQYFTNPYMSQIERIYFFTNHRIKTLSNHHEFWTLGLYCSRPGEEHLVDFCKYHFQSMEIIDPFVFVHWNFSSKLMTLCLLVSFTNF